VRRWQEREHDAHHHLYDDLGQHHEHAHHTHARQSHTDHEHSQLPEAAEGRIGRRSLLALGVAGGLLPCPSALVLMVGAIALGQIGFGLALAIAFSLGLAIALIAIGLTFLYTGRAITLALSYRLMQPGVVTPVLRVAPIGSALVIALLGLVMTVQALGQAGLLRM